MRVKPDTKPASERVKRLQDELSDVIRRKYELEMRERELREEVVTSRLSDEDLWANVVSLRSIVKELIRRAIERTEKLHAE